LDVDLQRLPEGAKSMIGPNGISLSGGQLARISFARAIYANADIYLLDDPLSAVDPKVAKHLFDRCIKLILKKKAVLLVTHLLNYIQVSTN
jgi:ATP-binding cassette, subfamily C (CFTR/MRP), member 4